MGTQILPAQNTGLGNGGPPKTSFTTSRWDGLGGHLTSPSLRLLICKAGSFSTQSSCCSWLMSQQVPVSIYTGTWKRTDGGGAWMGNLGPGPRAMNE